MQLRKGSDMARGDDAGKLKVATVEWVNELCGISTPPLRANSKDERGLDSDHTGRLLCPGEYAWDDLRYVTTEVMARVYIQVFSSVRANIREGHLAFLVTSQSWPLFLYANIICNVEDIEDGLFKGALLVKVCYTCLN